MLEARSTGFFLATVGVSTLLASTAAVAAVLILRSDGERGAGSPVGPPAEPDAVSSSELRELGRRLDRLEQQWQLLQTQRSESPSRSAAAPPSRPDEPTPGPAGVPPALPREGAGLAGKLQQLLSLRGPEQREERLALARELAADPTSPGRAVALQILVELSPQEGLAQLRAIAAEPEPDGGRRDQAGLWDRALTGLVRAQGIDVEAELRSLYATGELELQGAAARALRQKGDESLMKAFEASLENALHSSDSTVQLDALEQLGRLGGSRGPDLALGLLGDDDAEVRLRALAALTGGLDPRDLGRIEELAQDPDERVRSRAQQLVESLKARQRMMEERARRRDGR